MRLLSYLVVLLLLSGPLAGCTSSPDDNATVSGCTYPDALNFNESAVTDDGSCEYPPDPVLGCTNSSALNFNATADTDDGSCRHIQPHVLMVLLDGWRPDVIAAAHTPTIDMMMQDSAYSCLLYTSPSPRD